jgi:hypothetical protein
MQKQDTVASLETDVLKLTRNASGRAIQFTKTEAALLPLMNINNRGIVAQFFGSPQQNLGDVHFAKSLKYRVYFRITEA